ncbi:MAG: hypothetical protein ACFE98_20400 [Candidatus Hermodarchaeota archaeon]
MVVVSQIWIQHLPCMHIIGHCHLRGGTALEPELGGALYTALALALAEVEKAPHHTMSGIYGHTTPELEGMGIFTVQNRDYRIFFLCEGLYGHGIPYIAGKEIANNINNLFRLLEESDSQNSCIMTHKSQCGSYWFDLICLSGLGEYIPIEEITSIFPLQTVSFHYKQSTMEDINIIRMESSCKHDLGYGWKEKYNTIVKKIEGLFVNPKYSFLIYKSLFDQFIEFNPDFQPNLLVLTYQQGDLQVIQNAIIAILSLGLNKLTIDYCLPVTPGESLEGSHSISIFLNSLVLDSSEHDRLHKNIKPQKKTKIKEQQIILNK